MVSKYWKVGFIILIAAGAAGALALLINPKAMGTTSEVPWGLLIGTYVFFAVSSTGVGLIGSLAPVFGISKYQKLSHRGTVISLVLLLCGFGALALELGRPFNLIYILFSPNLAAPIWWMGFFYSLYLALLIIEIVFIIKKRHQSLPLLEKISFVVKIAAVSTLGAVFSMNVSRPFWQGAYFPIMMIVAAIASGAAILAIITYFNENWNRNLLPDMGKILLGALIVLGVGTLWKFLSALYSTAPADYLAAKSLLNGGWLLSFLGLELIVGVIIPALLLLRGQFQGKSVIVSSVLALIGLIFARLNFISAGQMAPLFPRDSFAYFNAYAPSLAEWAVLLGAVGVAVVVIAVAGKKIAVMNE